MASNNIYRKDQNKEPTNCAFPGCDRPIAHSNDNFADETCDQHRTQDFPVSSLQRVGPPLKPKKFVAEESCKHCSGTMGVSHSVGCPSEENQKALEQISGRQTQMVGAGTYPTLERGGGENVNESFTGILVESIATENDEDVVVSFGSTVKQKIATRLAEKVSLAELYISDSDHPEVKELIRQGFRLKKSSGGRDVLVGPGGERKVIKNHDGKVHIVSEGDNFIDCPECEGSGSTQKWRDDGRECGACNGNGYDKYGDSCESCGGVGFGSICKNCGGGGTVKGGLREGTEQDDTQLVYEGTVNGMWDESDEYIGYHGLSPAPEKGRYIYAHVPTGKVGFAQTAKEAREQLKGLHVTHVGREVAIREEANSHTLSILEGKVRLDEVSKGTLKSFVGKAVDDHSDLLLHRDSAIRRADQFAQQGPNGWSKAGDEDERADKLEHMADKRKEGIMRALEKLTKEEVQLNEIGNTPEGRERIHKYISFAKDDLLSAQLNRDQDLQRAIRHEDEASAAKTDDDRKFHDDRAKAFGQSAANTDKAIANRKKGIANAAKRILKGGGLREDILREEKHITVYQDGNGATIVRHSDGKNTKSSVFGMNEGGALASHIHNLRRRLGVEPVRSGEYK